MPQVPGRSLADGAAGRRPACSRYDRRGAAQRPAGPKRPLDGLTRVSARDAQGVRREWPGSPTGGGGGWGGFVAERRAVLKELRQIWEVIPAVSWTLHVTGASSQHGGNFLPSWGHFWFVSLLTLGLRAAEVSVQLTKQKLLPIHDPTLGSHSGTSAAFSRLQVSHWSAQVSKRFV